MNIRINESTKILTEMKKILIIEDDEIILENIAEFLKEERFETYTATDGVQGIQIAIEAIPDLIICDISIPKKDGYQVCKTLQEIPSTSTVPFIFLTAKIQKEDIRLGMQLGADDYLTKPFDYAELIKTIKIRLDKHERLIKQSDERFFNLIDNPIVGVYIYQDNKFIYSNSKLTDAIGYTKEELCFMSFEDLTYNEENNEALDKIHRCIKGIQNSVHTELKILKKDMTETLIEIFGVIIRIKGNECIMGNILEKKSGKNIKLFTGKNVDKSLFTRREIEILQLTCKGLSSTEMSEKLFVSRRTVETHRANLIAKTESRNTADLVMFAVRNNLIEL